MSSERRYFGDPEGSSPGGQAPSGEHPPSRASAESPGLPLREIELPTPLAAQIMARQVDLTPHDGNLRPAGEKEEGARPRGLSILVETLTVLILAILLALGLNVFLTQVYAISGQSMEPTLHDGERVVIHKLSPGIVGVERGDIIIFASPRTPRKSLIKRVIGLPGETVEIEDGVVLIDGVPLEEHYTRAEIGRYAHDLPPRLVPPGHVLVLGDNRPASQDSRHFGPIPMDSIKGEVFLRFWPLDMFSSLP